MSDVDVVRPADGGGRGAPVPEQDRPRTGARIPHVPGLDGLRGLAVIGVLCFHGGFGWASGGYLGVSAFFTLSGYLITSLLLAEHAQAGAVALGDFWERRIRRLLPAALLTLAGVAVYGATAASDLERVQLRGDLLGSLLYAANWRFLARGRSYAELQESPSLVQHFWSLAIEEQFYLVWPLLVFGLLLWRGRRGLAAVTAGLVVASIASCLLLWDGLGSSTDTVYYATPTRAAELLVGALLALRWAPGAPAAAGGRLQLAGWVALAAMVALWATTGQADGWQYRGGFAGHAVLTAVVVAAVVRPGPLGRALAWSPLRAVGLVSYGLYLYHWPVFVVLDEDRLDLARGPLFVVRLLVTLALTLASYVLVEQPVRRKQALRGGRVWAAGVVGMAAVALLVVVATREEPAVAFGGVDTSAPEITVVAAPPGAAGPAAAGGPPTVMTIGDSGMYDATPALRAVSMAAGATTSVEAAFPGVGLTAATFDWRADWAAEVAAHDPDLTYVMLGGFDLDFLEAEGPEAYGEVADELVEVLTAGGGRVVWLSVLPCGRAPDAELNEVFAGVAARHPGSVAYVDTADAFPGCATAEEVGGVTVPIRKPDEWHLCPLGAERFARHVQQAVADLGWAPAPAAGWEDGDWRADARYDDPPGGCETG